MTANTHVISKNSESAICDMAICEPQSTERRGRKAHRAVAVVGIYLFYLSVLIASMPVFFYPGDNFAPRAEAKYWLKTGEWGVPTSKAELLGELVERPGLYFVQNPTRDRYYSKYGIVYTMLSVIPVAFEQMMTGNEDLLSQSGTLLIVLNICQLLVASVVFIYLYRLAALFCSQPGVRLLFVLASAFGTFLWYYLRCHAHDGYQLAAFLGLTYHALSFVRQRTQSLDVTPAATRSLLLASTFLALLVHMRFSYALLYVPLAIVIALSGPDSDSIFRRLGENLWRFSGRYLWAAVLPAVLTIILLLFVQVWKFDSPFNTGYTTSSADKSLSELSTGGWWTLTQAPRGILRFLVLPGNANIFLHYPLLLISLLGWRRFSRRFRRETLCIVSFSAAIVFPLLGMHGEGYGYGPRYWLPAMMICSLPAISFFDSLQWHRRPIASGLLTATATFLLLCSCAVQWFVISTPFFGYHLIRDEMLLLAEGTKVKDEVAEYFDPKHIGFIHRDLMRYRNDGVPFHPMELLLSEADTRERDQLREHLDSQLMRYSAPNTLAGWIWNTQIGRR